MNLDCLLSETFSLKTSIEGNRKSLDHKSRILSVRPPLIYFDLWRGNTAKVSIVIQTYYSLKRYPSSGQIWRIHDVVRYVDFKFYDTLSSLYKKYSFYEEIMLRERIFHSVHFQTKWTMYFCYFESSVATFLLIPTASCWFRP